MLHARKLKIKSGHLEPTRSSNLALFESICFYPRFIIQRGSFFWMLHLWSDPPPPKRCIDEIVLHPTCLKSKPNHVSACSLPGSHAICTIASTLRWRCRPRREVLHRRLFENEGPERATRRRASCTRMCEMPLAP